MRNLKVKVLKSSFHRNGICGAGFTVSIFESTEDGETRTMVGVKFGTRGHTAVFDLKMLADQNIEFARGNSWRGDHFEPLLPGPDGKIFSPIGGE